MKKILISLFLLCALLAAGCSNNGSAEKDTSAETKETATTAESYSESTESSTELPEATTAEIENTEDATSSTMNGEMSVTMLDVGQGLSILVETDGEYLLYDGGGRSASSYVVSYLSSHGVDDLSYMVASHYDEDHIAGLVGVLNTTEVDQVLCPDYTKDTKIYSSFMNMLDQNGAKVVHPEMGETYRFGDGSFQILSADSTKSGDNDRSIVIRIEYGDFSCIITGDAEEAVESEMVSAAAAGAYTIASALYVAGHHGSSSSSSERFVQAVNPDYVFISVGEGNSYGHPHQETMEIFKENGVQIFRSDDQGEVTCYTDGSSCWFDTEPSDNWAPGIYSIYYDEKDSRTVDETEDTVKGTEQSEETTYILNTNTKKFHYPSCSSINSMSEKNKEEYTGSREDLINQGYSPCGNCNP